MNLVYQIPEIRWKRLTLLTQQQWCIKVQTQPSSCRKFWRITFGEKDKSQLMIIMLGNVSRKSSNFRQLCCPILNKFGKFVAMFSRSHREQISVEGSQLPWVKNTLKLRCLPLWKLLELQTNWVWNTKLTTENEEFGRQVAFVG